MKKILIFITLILPMQAIYAQSHFEVGIYGGASQYNVFKHKTYPMAYEGSGEQYGVTLNYVEALNDRFKLTLGTGYSMFFHSIDNVQFFNAQGKFTIEPVSSYLSLQGGIIANTFWKPLTFQTSVATYVLLQDKQDIGVNQERFFNILNLGFGVQLGKNLETYVSSGISLVPMFSGDKLSSYSGGLVDADVDLIGFQAGLRFKMRHRATSSFRHWDLKGIDHRLMVQLSQSLFYFDLIKEKEDIDGVFRGLGYCSSFDIWAAKRVTPQLELRSAVGFSQLLTEKAYASQQKTNSSYLNLKVALARQSQWKKLNWLADLSAFVLLHAPDSFDVQRKAFLNLNLGCEIALNEHLSVQITTPISLAPVFLNRYFAYFKEGTVPIIGDTGAILNIQDFVRLKDVNIGTAGLTLGINYAF